MNTDKTKLRDKRLADEKVGKPATKPNQRNTKYSQRFTPEAVKKDSEAAAAPAEVKPAKPEKPENNRRNNSKLKFTPEEKNERKVEKDKSKSKKKQTKLQHNADTVGEKLEKARSKADKAIANGQRSSNGKFAQQIKMAGSAAIHRKIGESENENVGTQAANNSEYAAERLYGASKNATRSAIRHARESPIRKAAKLENKSLKANMRLDLHKVSTDPKLKSNPLSRYMQKRRIKKQYAKAAREAKKGYQRAKQTAAATSKTTKFVAKLASNPKVWILLIIMFLIFFLISSCMSAFSFLMGGSNQILASTYLAEETDITGAELLYTEWETDLQIRANNARQDRPGYDEYRYNIGHIGHDPFELMAYLTAVYQDFNVNDITPALQTLFNTQYQIAYAETVEVRTRTETYTVTDPETGETTTETREVRYNWRILTVTLTARSLTSVMNMNDEQTAVYTANMASRGNRQFYGNPVGFNWLNLVSSRFGYRIHPITGIKNYHKGLDISLPIGTNILAVHDGTVITAGNDPDGYGKYIILENSEGLRSLYAHLDAFLVSQGQVVNQGDVIAKSGNTGASTGPHLHLETLKNGQYLNPVYFLEIGG